jgi:hypothetical protein
MLTDKIMIQTPMCPLCWRRGMIQVDPLEWERYQQIGDVQRCFTNTAAEREQIITGTHPGCFDKMYPQEN